jgi:hypothetical protein
MCYGICDLEGYMGGCNVSPISNKIQNELGYSPCFIGGNVCCAEEDELYEELVKRGKIKEMKQRIGEMQMEYYKEIDKLLKSI